MLITFESKSSPKVLMYQEHAQRIFDLLHKNSTRGVITAAEVGNALALLEREVALSRQNLEHNVEHDSHGQEESEASEHAQASRVSFAARAYPLLQMMRAAQANGNDIIWG